MEYRVRRQQADRRPGGQADPPFPHRDLLRRELPFVPVHSQAACFAVMIRNGAPKCEHWGVLMGRENVSIRARPVRKRARAPAHQNVSVGAPGTVAYRTLGVKGFASGFATLDTQFPVCSPAAKPNMDRPCPACAPLTTSPVLAGAHLFGALLLHFSVDKHNPLLYNTDIL